MKAYAPPTVWSEEHLMRRASMCGGSDAEYNCPEGKMVLTNHGRYWTVIFVWNHEYGTKEIAHGSLSVALARINAVLMGGTPFFPAHVPGAPIRWTHFEFDNSFRAVFHEGELRLRMFKGGWLLVHVTADEAFVPVAWSPDPHDFTDNIDHWLDDILKHPRKVTISHRGAPLSFQMSDEPGEIARCRLDHETVITLGEHDVEFKGVLPIPRLAVKRFGCTETLDVISVTEERTLMSPVSPFGAINPAPQEQRHAVGGRARRGTDDGVQPQPQHQDVVLTMSPTIKDAFISHLNDVAKIGGVGRAIRRKLVPVFTRLADLGKPLCGRGKGLQEHLARLAGGKLGCDRAFRYAMTTYLEVSCLIRQVGDDLVMAFDELRDPNSALARSLAPWRPRVDTQPTPHDVPIESAPPSPDPQPNTQDGARGSHDGENQNATPLAKHDAPTSVNEKSVEAKHDDWFEQLGNPAHAANTNAQPTKRIRFEPKFEATDPHDGFEADDPDLQQSARAPPPKRGT